MFVYLTEIPDAGTACFLHFNIKADAWVSFYLTDDLRH